MEIATTGGNVGLLHDRIACCLLFLPLIESIPTHEMGLITPWGGARQGDGKVTHEIRILNAFAADNYTQPGEDE
ncbi:hypothetical protein G7054_g12425 [Neopestalotiopsis clavispora]|nr:hypothetical protein G7054_g12425 [Neopestalotiopsis clavispora]